MIRWVFGADTKPFTNGLDKMRGQTRQFAKNIGGMIAGAFALGAVINSFKRLFTEMDRVHKLSQQFGASTDDIQKIGLASELAGANMEAVAKGLKKVTANASEARNGAKTMQDAFSQAGLDPDKMINASMTDQIIMIAEGLEKTSGSGEKLANVMKVMGGRASELMPLLSQGSEALKKQFDDTDVASKETIDQIVKFNDSITSMKQGIMVALSGIILPVKKFGITIGEWMTKIFALGQMVGRSFSSIGKVISAVASGDIRKIGKAVSDVAGDARKNLERFRSDINGITVEALNAKSALDGISSSWGKEEAEANERLKEIAEQRLSIEMQIANIKMEAMNAEEKARQDGLTTAEKLLELEIEKKKIIDSIIGKEGDIFANEQRTGAIGGDGESIAKSANQAQDDALRASIGDDNLRLAEIEAKEKELKRDQSKEQAEEAKKITDEQNKAWEETLKKFEEEAAQFVEDIAKLDAEKQGIIDSQAFNKMSDEDKMRNLKDRQAALNAEAEALAEKGDTKGQREKEIESLNLNDEIKSLIDGQEKIEAIGPSIATSSLASIGAGGSANLIGSDTIEQRKVSLLEQIASNTGKSETGSTKNPEPA